mmetsp:Transcript_9178/g.24721  ORF Transcript_9178/g.24721 Transcript_9178/m.24721 type:complete len:333 (-) Transcript_9178:102-1100(-)
MVDVAHGDVHTILIEVPSGHYLLGLNVCLVQVVGVVRREEVHLALRIGEHDAGRCEVAAASLGRCAAHSATACGAPSGHGSALIGGQGERDVLVLHATLYIAQDIEVLAPHDVCVLVGAHDQTVVCFCVCTFLCSHLLGTPLLLVLGRALCIMKVLVSLHGLVAPGSRVCGKKDACVVFAQEFTACLLIVLHAIHVVEHLVVEVLQELLEPVRVPEAQRPDLVMRAEGKAPLIRVHHVGEAIVHTHIQVTVLYLQEPILLPGIGVLLSVIELWPCIAGQELPLPCVPRSCHILVQLDTVILRRLLLHPLLLVNLVHGLPHGRRLLGAHASSA